MAEVRLCFGRRVCGFAPKLCDRSLLGSQKKRSNDARDASRLSAGLLLGDAQHSRRFGAGDSADALTGELCQRVYARGPSRCESVQAQHTDERRCGRAANFRGISSSFPWTRQNSRAYGGYGSRAEPLYRTKTGYYDALEVLPTATQAQIKTAYYKQSFIYHPDRNSGSDQATTRFSEISEAYAVLGSKALRKKYDRGLLSLSDLTATPRPTGSGRESAGSPVQRRPGGSSSSSSSAAGQPVRGGVFDFDTFYKEHYSQQLQRQRDNRVRQEMLKKQKETKGEKQLARIFELTVGMLLVTGLCVLLSLKHGWLDGGCMRRTWRSQLEPWTTWSSYALTVMS